MTRLAFDELPDLSDGVVRLRPWRVEDAPALRAAWLDSEVRRWTAVPDSPTIALAERWIAGEEERRQSGRALDLVVTALGLGDAVVVGEVGFVPAEGEAAVLLGWWTAAAFRRRGYATRAVTLLATWVRDGLGLEARAQIDPANAPSLAIGRAARIRVEGEHVG